MLSQKSKGRDFSVIAIEGPDYSGKSTIAEFVTNKFNQSNTLIKHNREFAHHYKRPGGNCACDSLREKVTNVEMDSDTRQVLAFAEEILFNYSNMQHFELHILDRFNPISGQIYGPDSTKKYWKFLIESEIVKTPDLTIFISTPLDILLKRSIERNSKNDVMDQYFCSKAERIVKNYNDLKEDIWFNKYFKHVTIHNNGLLDDVQLLVYNTIELELGRKNV